MIRFKKQENGNVLITDENDNITASYVAGMNVFKHPSRENSLLITDDASARETSKGLTISFASVDLAGCIPVITTSDVNGLIDKLSNDFFFRKTIPSNGGALNYLQTSYLGNAVNHSTTVDITITGDYFIKDNMEVTIANQTINSITYVNSQALIVNLTTNSVDGLYDIVVKNGHGEVVLSEGFEVKLSTWIDLRENGEAFTHGNSEGNDIRYRSGMSMVRDAKGMYFSGSNPWSSWVKFASLQWTRGENKILEWIFTQPNSSMMIGIGSTATNETNTAQYAQAVVQAYFSGSTNFWGLYGNNGSVDSAGSQGNGISISTGTYKIKFEQDGGAGKQFTLYKLPSTSASDWDDENNILKTFVIGGSLNPDEQNIMPFIIPRSGGAQRFVAIKID